jgi:hypothetical protein
MTTRKEPFIQHARAEFHKSLLLYVLSISTDGVATNADKKNTTSVAIALHIAKKLEAETGVRVAGQTSGNAFERCVASFVETTFLKLPHLRPICSSGRSARFSG